MSDLWEVLRIVNFLILFIAFMVMIYKGVFNLALKGEIQWDRLMNLFWVSLGVYSIGEVLYLSVQGGFRIIVMTLVGLLQLYVVVFRFKINKEDA